MGARGAVAGLGFVLFAGCGGGDETQKPNNPAPPSIASLVEAFCQAARSCCGRSAFGNQQLADCEAEFVRQTDLATALASGKVTVDKPLLDQCAAAYRRASTECVASDELRNSCTGRLFRGSVSEGGACDDALECFTGEGEWVCLKTSSSELGVCKRAPRGRSGDACFRTCDDDDDPCLTTYSTSEANPAYGICKTSEGVYCTGNACAPLLAEGAACTDDEMCGAERYCLGTCRRKKAEGEACERFSECALPLTCLEGRCAVRPIANENLCSGDLN